MKMEHLKHKMRRLQWNANKRTVAKRVFVGDAILDEIDALRETGKLDEAQEVFGNQDPEACAIDYRAQLTLGLVHFGLDDLDAAEVAFDRASALADQIKAETLLNKANLLKVKGNFDAAIELAYETRELAPHWFASHLIIIAAHECRGSDADINAVRDAIQSMKEMLPEWHMSAELWSYLKDDVDYIRLRERSEFSELLEEALSLTREEEIQ